MLVYLPFCIPLLMIIPILMTAASGSKWKKLKKTYGIGKRMRPGEIREFVSANAGGTLLLLFSDGAKAVTAAIGKVERQGFYFTVTDGIRVHYSASGRKRYARWRALYAVVRYPGASVAEPTVEPTVEPIADPERPKS